MMNTSELTAVIAEGIMLWAAVQNLSESSDPQKRETVTRDWGIWCDDWPRYVETAQAEQYALFDRLNARF